MDEIRLAERIFKLIRARQTQVIEIVTSNQVKDWNDYQNHLGQLDTLNYIEQELSDLLKKQEQDYMFFIYLQVKKLSFLITKHH